ncbi:MAG TPA: hypothetical protein VFV85_01265 [Conexibacter sp.]|nr:hypothetical protein [Conexibacter sp.]
MLLAHAALGLLVEQACYEEELAQRLRQRVIGWQPPRAEVLRGLGLLRDRRFIRSRSGDGWYEPTFQGSRAFESWMRTSPPHLLSHDELKVRFVLMRLDHFTDLHRTFREQHRLCVDRLGESIRTASLGLASQDDQVWQLHRNHLVSQAEAVELQMTMTLLQYAIEVVEPFIFSAGERAKRRG